MRNFFWRALAVLAGLVAVGIVALLVIAIAVGEEQRHHRRNDVVSTWHDGTNRTHVRDRLGDPSLTANVKVGARSVSCDVFNADESILDAWVQFSFCYRPDGERVASPDPLEPNEDVPYLRTYRIPPLTRPGRPWANIHGRLDYWPHRGVDERLFDDDDVYRIWLPARRAVHIRLEPTADVALEVWDSSTPTVTADGAARERHSLTYSDAPGARAEEVTLSRRSATTRYVFLDVYLLEHGPDHAEYHLTVRPTT